MHICVSVCVCVCLCAATCPHYCTDPDVTCGNGRGCSLDVQYWADLQSLHGFLCYDNIAPCGYAISAHDSIAANLVICSI